MIPAQNLIMGAGQPALQFLLVSIPSPGTFLLLAWAVFPAVVSLSYGTNNWEGAKCLSETLNHLDFASVRDLPCHVASLRCLRSGAGRGWAQAELSLQVPGDRPCPAHRPRPGRAHHQLQRAAHADGQRVPGPPAALRGGGGGPRQGQPQGCHPGPAGRWGQSPPLLWPFLGASRTWCPTG